ncbi:hypothetical protein UFOVP1622_28 [uncultured Caudovirales phage]|uniref:Uncharacterized protein n=1 Tax=uncultured Caudovirales phage TaxID=2100421 RepID=A0A6J5SWS7_9CAUD|nr:hypothetical protein UFOVP1021_7 [uncultured Caudovirales phage]CAB4219710.1 hypothetical protein UFOVP1622_28 [uncultured Caudovirales phage]
MIIIGIDPGSTHSGICMVPNLGDIKMPNIIRADKVANDKLIQMLETNWAAGCEIAIEDLVSYTHGRHIDLTQRFIGFIQCKALDCKIAIHSYTRREYGQWITAGGKLSDATLRAGLESIYGASSKKTDPLYKLRGATDKRSAFAIAKYHEFRISKGG